LNRAIVEGGKGKKECNNDNNENKQQQKQEPIVYIQFKNK